MVLFSYKITRENNMAKYDSIPAHMRDELQSYLEKGTPIYGFLRDMMEHKIYEAAIRADAMNLVAIPNYIGFMYYSMPIAAHGSKENVDLWIATKAYTVEVPRG
jgi:hypothetical protein